MFLLFFPSLCTLIGSVLTDPYYFSVSKPKNRYGWDDRRMHWGSVVTPVSLVSFLTCIIQI